MKTKIRVLSAIMTVAMILSSLIIVIPTSVSAATTSAETWATHAATAFAGGKGTADDPYEIANAAQLAYLAKLVRESAKDSTNGNVYYSTLAYELTDDINATAYQWAPIGYKYGWGSDVAFMGKFHGNGHTVSTVLNDLTNWDKNSTGASLLFGTLSSATVEGVTLNATLDYDKIPKKGAHGVTADVNNTVFGLFAGALLGASKVTDCHVVMNVTGTTQSTGSEYPVGGFFGYVNAVNGVVDGCSLGGSLYVRTKEWTYGDADANKKKSIVRYAADADGVANDLKYSFENQIQFGGFVGAQGGEGKFDIKNCVNKASITLVGGGHQVFLSGLIGSFWNANGTVVNVENFVDISSIRTKTISQNEGLDNSYTYENSSMGNYYLHYGSVVGRAKYDNYTQTVKMSGVVAAPTLTAYAAGWTETTAGVANLMSTLTRKAHATNKFSASNCFTTNPIFPDIHTHSANKVTITDVGKDKEIGGAANMKVDLDAVTAAQLSYAPDVENNKILVTVPKALFDIFKSIDKNANVTYGGIAATSNAVSGDNYVFTVEGISGGGVGAIVTDLGTLTDNWTAYASAPTKGTGTATDPYEIATEGNLAYLNYGFNSVFSNGGPGALYNKHYKLTANLDLAHREFRPLGSHTNPNLSNLDWCFSGTFDGDNYKIENMTQTDRYPSNWPSGLFGGASNSTVKNLTLTGSIKRTISSGEAYVGIGMVCGGFTHATGKIDNVDVDADIEVVTTVNRPYVGGLMAVDNNSYIGNSTMSGSVKVTAAEGMNMIPMAGGFIGRAQGVCTVENCVNYADITLQANASNHYAGGIVALAAAAPSTQDHNCTTIKNCVNYGNFNAIKGLSGTATSLRFGGMVGNSNYGGKASMVISNCTNFGTFTKDAAVAARDYITGDVIGYNDNGTHSVAIDTIPKSTSIDHILSLKQSQTDDQKAVQYTKGTIYTTNPDTMSSEKWIVAPVSEKAVAITGEERYFEIGTIEKDGKAIVSATKLALDIFLNSHHTMALTYGKTVITNLDGATVSANGRAYEWTFKGDDYVAKQKAALTITDPLGKVAATKAGVASWAGVYASASVEKDSNGYYKIYDGGDIGYIARMVNMAATNAAWRNAKMKLMSDIDLGAARFITISQSHTDIYAFRGELIGTKADGGSYTLSNVRLTDGEYVYNKSMFGKTMGDFLVKDLNLVNPKVGSDYIVLAPDMGNAALIAGSIYGSKGIDNVHVTGLSYNISGSIPNYYGGLVGYMAGADSYVKNTTVQGTIAGSRNDSAYYIGGIVGRAKLGTVENCVVDLNANIGFLNLNSNGRISLLIGIVESDYDDQKVNIKNNTVTGSLNVSISTGTANDDGKKVAIGGLVGGLGSKGTQTITGNVVKATISYDKKGEKGTFYAGSLIGYVPAKTVAIDLNGNYELNNSLEMIGCDEDNTETAANNEWNVAVETEGEASVRIDKTSEANSGLRFDSAINTALYNAMKADSNVTVEIGTIIAPTVLMQAYNGKFDQLPMAVKVVYDVDKYAADESIENDVEGFASVKDGKSYFTGAIINVLPANYELEFTAVAYVTVTINGVSHTYYAEYDENDDTRARSIYEVAYEAYYDRAATRSDEYGTYVGDNHEKGNYSLYSKAQLNVLREYLGI